MALFDFFCEKCKRYFEVFFMPKERPTKTSKCSKCGTKSTRIPGAAGYQGDLGSASVRPKGAGAKSRKK